MRLEGYQAPHAKTQRIVLQALQPVYATEHRAAGACRGFSLRAHGLARSGAAVESPASERTAAAHGEPAPAPLQPSAAEQAPAGAAYVPLLVP